MGLIFLHFYTLELTSPLVACLVSFGPFFTSRGEVLPRFLLRGESVLATGLVITSHTCIFLWSVRGLSFLTAVSPPEENSLIYFPLRLAPIFSYRYSFA